MIATRVNFRITLKRVAAYGAMLFICTAFGAAAQNTTSQSSGANSPNSNLNAQPGAAPSSNPGMANQGGDDATLEISPQTGVRPPNGSSDEIPANREFRPNDDTATLNRNFKPGEQDSNLEHGGHVGSGRSCLGIQVNYTNYCFKGAEEHGLEVVSIDRNSPAEKAGLKAAGNSGVITAAETAGALLGPLQIITNHFLENAAQGQRGDLIVAIDDQRVRSQADLDDAMAKARPGDTLYMTVIRPMPGGDHKTMKIAVNVGKWNPEDVNSCGEFVASSQSKPSN
jgi:hypothetical protein